MPGSGKETWDDARVFNTKSSRKGREHPEKAPMEVLEISSGNTLLVKATSKHSAAAEDLR